MPKSRSKQPNTGIFPGRFQPFHLGHLAAIKQMLNKVDRLVIVIGSTSENFLPDNPFTAGERLQMVESALQEAKIPRGKYAIIPVPNINNFAIWPKHLELYLPPFDCIFTGSPIVRELFETHNQSLKKPYAIVNIKTFSLAGKVISASHIRELMLNPAGRPWEKFVPPAVAKLIKQWNGVNRLKKILFMTNL